MTSKQQPQQSIRLKIKFQAFKQKRGLKEVELFIQKLKDSGCRGKDRSDMQ